MKSRFGILIFGCGIFLVACQLGLKTTMAPPPTMTAPPPMGLIPTVTPVAPTASPGVVTALLATATPLPVVTATPDPNLGVGDVVYEDKLNGQSGWGWGYLEQDVATFSTAGGQLDAVMLKPNVGPRFSISPDTLKIGDQQVRVTARANLCYNLDEYGLMFRIGADPAGNYLGYVFKLNCAGAARVETLRGTSAEVLVDWTPGPAIVSGAPAENTLMVWMVKNQFHFYVNDKYLVSLTDSTFAEGFYGFYVRDRTNGGESVSFTNLVAKAVTLP
jgi:hypothetical protein